MTRLLDGLTISVEGNITTHNVIHKTALGRTYHSYLKREASKYLWSNQSISIEDVIDAWCDCRSYRYKKILSRLFKRFTNKMKSYKIIIRK